MYRPLVSRSTCPAIYPGVVRFPIASRTLVTPPPPPSPSSPQGQSGAGQTSSSHPEGSNTLIILSSLGALGGLYYYYTRGQPAVDRETARRKEEETERRVREIGEAGKSKLENAVKREYGEAKATVKDAATISRTWGTEARTELADRARQGVHEAQAKLDDIKGSADRKISDARERSERKIEESRGEFARQAHDAENKNRSWFGWGSSK